jgi:biopolymer transport protein ExbD
MAFQRDDSNGHHDVNLTPLIDVSLVLVVILLLTSPLALESSILVRSNAASGKKAAKDTKMDYVELRIVSRDVVEVNRKAVDRMTLKQTLAPLVEGSTSGRVILTCAGDVPHGVFVDVLDQIKQSGAADIAVTGN